MSFTPDWIAVDWGTSNMRAWAMAADGQDLAKATSDKGMGDLTPDQFEATLLDTIRDWTLAPGTPVLACGMVGARQGWVEAPYAKTPCPPQSGRIEVLTKDPRLSMHIIGGLSQASPPDVMRGEETQIAGFLHLNKNWDGVICLPGTHTKWVHVSADEVVSFQTLMTGELFALLSGNSVLKHSVGEGWDAEAFQQAIDTTLSRPANLTARLFAIRAGDLLNNTRKAQATATLSGLLIGAELAATKPYWLGQSVAVIGATSLARHYVEALTQQGVPAIQADADTMTLAGLRAAYKQLKG